jgi:hypothetical protein
MEWIYSCPKCTAILNPGPSIILLGRHEGREALLAFHPEPGNYEVGVPHNVIIRKGELWDFFCPVCHDSISVSGKNKLAGLEMTDGNDNWYKVIFSRIAGEYATFVITRGPELKVKKLGVDFTKYENCLWKKYL